jgi:hypothetical protein
MMLCLSTASIFLSLASGFNGEFQNHGLLYHYHHSQPGCFILIGTISSQLFGFEAADGG